MRCIYLLAVVIILGWSAPLQEISGESPATIDIAVLTASVQWPQEAPAAKPPAPPVQVAKLEQEIVAVPVEKVEMAMLPPPSQDAVDRKLIWTIYSLQEKEDRTGPFAWKDEKAAARAGVSLEQYTVGCLDKTFVRKVAAMLRALEQDGYSPGIMTACRDDYRQSLIDKRDVRAKPGKSRHGGSAWGGIGRAVDIVHRAPTPDERWAKNAALWKWIDQHRQEYGLWRPFPSKGKRKKGDPMHVEPLPTVEIAAKQAVKVKVASIKKHKPKKKRIQVASAKS
jgi:hypothetical protein